MSCICILKIFKAANRKAGTSSSLTINGRINLYLHQKLQENKAAQKLYRAPSNMEGAFLMPALSFAAQLQFKAPQRNFKAPYTILKPLALKLLPYCK